MGINYGYRSYTTEEDYNYANSIKDIQAGSEYYLCDCLGDLGLADGGCSEGEILESD